MDHYEIRVLRDDRNTALIFAAIYPDDNAAMQCAREIARARKFEVWRGADCIHGTGGATVIKLASPGCREA
jgi:hypothetical protein